MLRTASIASTATSDWVARRATAGRQVVVGKQDRLSLEGNPHGSVRLRNPWRVVDAAAVASKGAASCGKYYSFVTLVTAPQSTQPDTPGSFPTRQCAVTQAWQHQNLRSWMTRYSRCASRLVRPATFRCEASGRRFVASCGARLTCCQPTDDLKCSCRTRLGR